MNTVSLDTPFLLQDADEIDMDTVQRKKARAGKIARVFIMMAPYCGAAGTLIIVVLLLGTMYLTRLDLQWVTFLSGVLMAAILAMATRSARADWMIARRTAQLSSVKEKLARETRLRLRADQALSLVSKDIKSSYDSIPAMLVHIDMEQRVTSHNHSFRQWLGLATNQIDGHLLREVLGIQSYAEIEGDLMAAFAGNNIHAERSKVQSNGAVLRLLAQYLPQFGDVGQMQGVFMMLTDITGPKDALVAAANLTRPGAIQNAAVARSAEQRMYVSAMSEELTGWDDSAARIRTAIDKDEFCLFCQTIIALAPGPTPKPFHEILLRLTEEEKGLMPPGSFLPIAEQHGLLPELDRWVVRSLLDWISADDSRLHAGFSVNVAAETIIDTDFPQYVREKLQSHGISGSTICFEFTETAASQWPKESVRFITQLKMGGCQFALTGFGRNIVSFELLKQLPVDWLKIDSSMILNLLRNPVDLARVKAINEVAHKMRIRTIAECVEDDATIAKLRELRIDFAQGFGISRPKPLFDLTLAAP